MYDCIMVVVLWAFVFVSGLAAAYVQYNPKYPDWKSDVLQVLCPGAQDRSARRS